MATATPPMRYLQYALLTKTGSCTIPNPDLASRSGRSNQVVPVAVLGTLMRLKGVVRAEKRVSWWLHLTFRRAGAPGRSGHDKLQGWLATNVRSVNTTVRRRDERRPCRRRREGMYRRKRSYVGGCPRRRRRPITDGSGWGPHSTQARRRPRAILGAPRLRKKSTAERGLITGFLPGAHPIASRGAGGENCRKRQLRHTNGCPPMTQFPWSLLRSSRSLRGCSARRKPRIRRALVLSPFALQTTCLRTPSRRSMPSALPGFLDRE